MKRRPIPDTDLARITPLPVDRQRTELEHLRESWAPYSYTPVRTFWSDILNISTAMLGETTRPTWDSISREIERKCRRSEDEIAANLAVGLALYEFAEENATFGRREEFFPMTVGVFTKLRFWSPAVVMIKGSAMVVHLDPRKSSMLDARSRKFVFSVMHERIRRADPDFAKVSLGIVQVPSRDKQTRKAVLHTDTGVELYDFETLDRMVRTTYEIWWDVLADKEETRRAGGSGSVGPLFGT